MSAPRAEGRRGIFERSGVPFVLSLVILLGAWEVASANRLISTIILPRPSAIVESLYFMLTRLFGPGAYMEHIATTLAEVIPGFILGSLVALVLGALVEEYRVMRRIVMPYVIALNAAPKIAFAPLFIVWLGFGIEPKIVMAAFICAFPVFVNTVAGLSSVEEEQLELMASLRATRWNLFWRLKFFQALPYIFAGLRTAMILAVIGAVVGEFSGGSKGLGYLIKFGAANLATDDVYAVVIVLSVIGYVLYSVVDIVERRVVFWSAARRAVGRTA
jgi:NitT/TauT family transport system permease protein